MQLLSSTCRKSQCLADQKVGSRRVKNSLG